MYQRYQLTYVAEGYQYFHIKQKYISFRKIMLFGFRQT